MMTIFNKKVIYSGVLNILFLSSAFAAYNPASTEYVNQLFDKAIDQAVKRAVEQSTYTGTGAINIDPNTNVVSSAFTGSAGILVNNTTGEITGYTAGTGIAINGSVISANGQVTPYTGTGAIDVNASTNVISSVFQNTASILVDNDAATITGNYQGKEGIQVNNATGEITGYTAGTGIAINGSVISANSQGTPYTGTGAIDVNASTNVISSVFQNTASILVDNDAATITGNYQGKEGIQVNNATGEITGYTAGTGIKIDGSTISQSGGVEIGNVLAGGVVVYVDPSKSYGLVLATTDQSATKMKYSANANEYVSGTGLGSGLINTAALLARISSDAGADIAAFAASTWFAQNDGQSINCTTPVTEENTCYGGWFLPSIYEWQYVTANLTAITTALNNTTGATPLLEDLYWSSTSDFSTGADSTRAYLINPNDPNSLTVRLITNADGHVRAMRKFYI